MSAEATLYVELTVSPESGYCYIKDLQRDIKRSEAEILEEYRNVKSILEKMSTPNRDVPTYEAFRKRYFKTTVKLQGRRRITEEDIMQALEWDGVVEKVGRGDVFGGYYRLREEV